MKDKNIVLLHGWGASVTKLRPLEKKLESLGWNVLVPKLPGFDTGSPGTPWKLQDYAKFVIKKADSKFKTENYLLFGHSFGGRVAVKIAADVRPNKLEGIVLCASGGISRTNVVKRYLFLALSRLGKILLILPPASRLFRKLLYKLAREHDYEKANKVMKKTLSSVVNEGLKTKLSAIEIPTLILWGDGDRATPLQDAYFLKNNIKRSEIEIYKDQGHRLPYEKPNILANRIDKWIKSA